VSTTTLRDEVTDLLQRLIRVDTTNPPGNETAAAELLRDYLEPNGIECELIAKVPERANLVARIPGGDGPSLLFLGHTDVVLADPAEWSVPPFSGELRDGMVWGRGALDMKSQVAASAVAVASLAREGHRLSGDVVLLLTADEEVNDDYGLSWLVEEHPELVRGGVGVAVDHGAVDGFEPRRSGDNDVLAELGRELLAFLVELLDCSGALPLHRLEHLDGEGEELLVVRDRLGLGADRDDDAELAIVGDAVADLALGRLAAGALGGAGKPALP